MTGGDRALDGMEQRIAEWTDEALVAEYRRLKGELGDSEGSAHAVEEEMRRRALTPDRENLIPDADRPDREREPNQVSRGTAPDAGEDTPG